MAAARAEVRNYHDMKKMYYQHCTFMCLTYDCLGNKQASKPAKKKPTTLEQNKNQSCDFITVKVIDVWVIYGIDFKERKT